MAWGSKTNIFSQDGASSIVESTEEYSSAVDLNPGEQAHVEVDAYSRAASTVTDDLEVSVYGNMTDSADWDEIALYSFTITPSAAQTWAKASFIMSGLYQFRVGVKVSGATDDYNVKINQRRDGVDL